jgi:putative Ca2+/H+ antiporter (TMEM165/GDT1 family)
MAEFLTVVAAAAVAQLAVLPGEKVQFIIAALSTRYRPSMVVGAAGLSFAGWTALEIWFGSALKGTLPPLYLDLISGGLFLLFGVLLLRSMPATGGAEVVETDEEAVTAAETGDAVATADAPGSNAETDGGMASLDELDVSVAGRTVPKRFGSFLPIFALMATGEFGDKTQLVTISLAIEYGAHPGIWVGEMLAIIPVSLANAYFFSRFAGRFDPRKAHLAGAGLFFFFGLDTLQALVTGVSVWETIVDAIAGAFAPVMGWLVAGVSAVAPVLVTF